MNRPQAVTALRNRGYGSHEAVTAADQARARGSYALGMHEVTYNDRDGYKIALVPPPGSDPDQGVWDFLDSRPLLPDPDQDQLISIPEYASGQILRIIEVVDRHLDEAAPAAYRDNPLANRWRRIAGGPGCECHESVEALLGVTGGNPRKGTHGTEADILAELGDTAVSALLAIQSQTKDIAATWGVFLAALGKAYRRVPEEDR